MGSNSSDLDHQRSIIDVRTGFIDQVDLGFAQNSATYLLNQSYDRDEVAEILIDELGLSADQAATLLARQTEPIT